MNRYASLAPAFAPVFPIRRKPAGSLDDVPVETHAVPVTHIDVLCVLVPFSMAPVLLNGTRDECGHTGYSVCASQTRSRDASIENSRSVLGTQLSYIPIYRSPQHLLHI
jgi:hypothetical protein